MRLIRLAGTTVLYTVPAGTLLRYFFVGWACSKYFERGKQMFDDLKMIVHRLPVELPYINLYSFGDKHIGSQECDLKRLKIQVDIVLNDPYGYCIFCGDLIDNGLKNSKTNVYQQTMSPMEQKEMVFQIFKPLAD